MPISNSPGCSASYQGAAQGGPFQEAVTGAGFGAVFAALTAAQAQRANRPGYQGQSLRFGFSLPSGGSSGPVASAPGGDGPGTALST